MKILILNPGDENSLGHSYRRAFESLGHEARVIDPERLLERSTLWRNRVTRRLFERRIIAAFNRRWLPELIKEEADLLWIGKGAWAVPEFWKELRRARPELITVCYNADNPIVSFSRGGNRPWVTESIPCFDLFCTYNRTIIEELEQRGTRNVLHVPFAWDPAIHPRQAATAPPDHDLLFIGNGDAHREQWLTKILEAANGNDWKVAVYGLWPEVRSPVLKKAIHNHQIVGIDMARSINRSKITLNILRLQNEGSHNMRTFEIPGSGGIMASQRSEEQDSFFPDEQAAIYFDEPNDAVRKISALFEDDEKRRRLQENARRLAEKNTYRERAASILEAVDEIKQKRARFRLGVLSTHPIQYQAPLFRLIAEQPDIDLQVFFASDEGAKKTTDPGFGVSYSWNVPLLDGYRWKLLENKAKNPSPGRLLGSDVPGIYDEMTAGRFDAVLIFGWARRCYLQAYRACRISGTPLIIRGEGRIIHNAGWFKNRVKRVVFSRFLKKFAAFLEIGVRNRQFYEWCNIPAEERFFAPYCVDNRFFSDGADACRPERDAIRKAWGFSPGQTIFLFGGKFIPKKRPEDIAAAAEKLIAEGLAQPGDFGILYVGAGPLEAEIRNRVAASNLPVTFAGFLNQDEIAKAYTAADCFILPSEYWETWGLVVNEAMASGLPVIVSDQVGSAADLVKDGKTGYVFPMGDVDALKRRMSEAIRSPESLVTMGAEARKHVADYCFETCVTGIRDALEWIAVPDSDR